MKNFFMALAMVAMVATSCSKDDVPNVSAPQKSVKFSLENVISTRGWDGMISASKVQLNDCQVFFVGADGSLYTGKNSDGTADAEHYFTSAPTETLSFHFLPAAVQKVVVVGNYGSELNPVNLNAIKDIAAEASAQQDDENLLVYGEAELVATTDDDHGNTYVAEVSVKPLVSRIEIGGFVCEFSDEPLYEQVDITMMALNNYYSGATLGGARSGYSSTAISSSSAYPFFNDTTAPAYSKNVISGVSLTPESPSVDFNTTDYLVYHTFAGDIPQLVVRVAGYNGGVESPLYLATSSFYDGATKIEEFEAGKVYRMKFNGENRFAFDDTDLNQPEKCIKVDIQAEEWVIVNVTPEF
ncbi:MAG: hypothetical protein IKY51_03925 [Alistipes sp.]|nr:hypothetical protein [Alistipes sp.]